jgi:hypothetical protein
MAELENTSSFDAENWLLSPVVSQDMYGSVIYRSSHLFWVLY